MNKAIGAISLYWGLFITSLTILALEISLTRLLSVLTWYYLAFFAISTAILGMTVGSVVVYLNPSWFTPERLPRNLALFSLAAAFVIPFCLAILIQIPATTSVLSLVSITFFSFLPFLALGVNAAAILTRSDLPIGKLYASDLAGAAMGSLFVLLGMEHMSTPNVILLCGALSAFAAICFNWDGNQSKLRVFALWVGGITLLMVFILSYPENRIRPVTAKGKFESRDIFLEKWNSYSRVTASKPELSPPLYWSPSPLRPADFKVIQSSLKIDSDAGTTIRKFSTLDDIQHLRYEGTNLVHFLRPQGTACIIGFGGGKDILGAILFGHEHIVAIDVNRIFSDLLNNEFRELAGIADYPGVELITDEARSYLSRNNLDCEIIQMSLTDTWAATGAGAYSLSENGLYTIDAWQIFLRRLSENGILTVSRWFNPEDLGETGRLVSLAMASLFKNGSAHPSQHLAMIRVDYIATLLVSKQPFTPQDIQKINDVSAELQYDLVLVPGIPPQNEKLLDIVSSQSLHQLTEFSESQYLNILPPTDENPYFFNQLRLKNIWHTPSKVAGIIHGNLRATINLLGLIFSLGVMAIFTIVIPLRLKTSSHPRTKKDTKKLIAGGFYFSMIGAGFMLVEIALTQRFSVFLGHPIYSLAVILFTIIASSGYGSYVSERLAVDQKPLVFLIPTLTSALILLDSFGLRMLLPALSSLSMPGKVLITVSLILPLGFMLGFFFPMGMRIVRKNEDENSPWYWALNGIFGTLCSAIAVLISIQVGIHINFYVAAMCYLALLVPSHVMRKKWESV